MALQLDPNSGLPLDPATLQMLQEKQMMQSVAETGGSARERQNNATVSGAANTLFPNLAMRQSQQMDAAMKAQNLQPQAGEAPMDFNIRQLSAMRNAAASIDPQAALHMTDQLAKLQQAKEQQSHLQAEDQRLADEHTQALRTQTIQSATGIPVHLVGPNGSPLGDFDLATDQGKQDFATAKQKAPPGSIGMSDAEYAKHVATMQEIRMRADEGAAAKARYQLGGGFGDPEIESLLASMASKGINLPTGFRSKDQMLGTFRGLLDKYKGLTTDDIADLVGKGIVDFKAVQKATQTGATILGRVTAASGELDAMLPIARDAAAGVNNTDFVPYNKLAQMVRQGTSSPEQKRLYVATQAILNSYDLLAARGGTDATKRAQQHQMLETADGPAAYNAALEMLEKESKVARAGAMGAIRAGTYGLADKSALAAQDAAQPPVSPPAGANTPMAFKSEADIPANLPKGTKIVVNGVAGTWQ
jgi:hypothetical protein